MQPRPSNIRLQRAKPGFAKRVGVIVVAVVTSVAVGALFLVAEIAVDDGRSTLTYSLTSHDGVSDFVAILALVIFPASLPMSVVGGFVAAVSLGRDGRGRSLRSWVTQGAGWGVGLGASGCLLWFGATNTPEPGRLPFLFVVAVIGACAGGGVGAVTGAYCWWTSRAVPPNKQYLDSSGQVRIAKRLR